MRMIDLIIKKRDKQVLTKEEIHYIISEYSADRIPDYQVSALLMAIFLNGLSDEELFCMCNEMIHSGEVLDFSNIPGIKVDKHSTGGVGDKVSLILAPVVAACGGIIPMMSGRGLGHTGGTLDKLESIAGFKVFLEGKKINQILSTCGFVMMGQTEKMVPADKRLYALRDVTGTVDSIPLIASSIMSKKIAEGTDALVMDLKCGTGAFMKTLEKARTLGQKIMGIGKLANKKVGVLITNMDQPIGNMIGNYLEVIESAETLKGKGPADLVEVTIELAARMIYFAEKASSITEGRKLALASISSGKAYELFVKNIEMQGGDTSYVEKYDKYPTQYQKDILSPDTGYIEELEAYQMGIASTIIGAGRQKKEDIIDYACGIELFKKVGHQVNNGDKIATIYYNSPQNIEQSVKLCNDAIKISKNPIKEPPVIIEDLKL
ncbi:MAG: thymidine phosphorylase [Spirochaetes bacterium]|nr:thymidine phosphorylase [Spirochaetota bacterium]